MQTFYIEGEGGKEEEEEEEEGNKKRRNEKGKKERLACQTKISFGAGEGGKNIDFPYSKKRRRRRSKNGFFLRQSAATMTIKRGQDVLV